MIPMKATRQQIPSRAGRLEYCSLPCEAAREALALLVPDGLTGVPQTGFQPPARTDGSSGDS